MRIAISFSLFFALIVSFVNAADDVVMTKYGPVQGIVTESYRAFKGIPYAAPPVGANRWSSPVAPSPWTAPFNATQWGAGCPQKCILPPHTCPARQSEDCLTLNVFTPTTSNLQTLQPVMAFIPGGHFEQGASGVELYEGNTFVNRSGVILVTMNYRLGALGWLVTDSLKGNFGLEDQRFALQWIQDNIKAFGGDPSQVTLFGQSAGGSSLAAHLISPLSAPLFHQAIIQSDPFSLPLRDDASSLGNRFAGDLNCGSTNVSCLRSKSIEDILDAQELAAKHVDVLKPLEVFLPWTPYVDGSQVPLHAIEAFQKGQYNKVPIMLGTVSEDALLFIYKADANRLTMAEYVLAVFGIFHLHGTGVLHHYPAGPGDDQRPELSVLGTDYIFGAPTRYVGLLMSQNLPNSVYLYQFNHSLSYDAWGPLYPFCNGHCCHGSELPFVFNSGNGFGFHFTAEEEKLSLQMIDYWTNFGRTGNPNKGTHPPEVQWPSLNSNTLTSIELATPQSYVVKSLLGEKYAFWDSLGYHWGW